MAHDYAALLKAHRDIPVLSTGINNTVTQESTFPTKEHPSLLTHTGKQLIHHVKDALHHPPKINPSVHSNNKRA